MLSPVALLDANVLYPQVLRDLLLYSVTESLFEARWTAEALEEMSRNLVADEWMTAEQANRLCELIRDAYEDGEVTGYQHSLREVFNHPKDRHVAAAALHARVDILVTNNLGDFVPAPAGIGSPSASS